MRWANVFSGAGFSFQGRTASSVLFGNVYVPLIVTWMWENQQWSLPRCHTASTDLVFVQSPLLHRHHWSILDTLPAIDCAFPNYICPGCHCRPTVKYLSKERSEATGKSHVSSGPSDTHSKKFLSLIERRWRGLVPAERNFKHASHLGLFLNNPLLLVCHECLFRFLPHLP